MLKKPNYQEKSGNISKIKYFLPSGSENKTERREREESRLHQIKRQINDKYKASYSSSKKSSKRPSVHQIQSHTNSQHTEINLNNDVSFEIVGVRDTNEVINEQNNSFLSKCGRYPLFENNYEKTNSCELKSKITDQHMTFRNQQQKRVNFSDSAIGKITKVKDFQKFSKNFPKPEQKEQFQRFLQNLKNDQNYQNTITMFTIMYFYEQKAKTK